VSGLKGLFDGNREARLVQPGDSYKLSVQGRHPPPKHHPTRTRHCEQIAIPRRLRGVGGQGAVETMVMGELFEVGEKVQGTDQRGSTTPRFRHSDNRVATQPLNHPGRVEGRVPATVVVASELGLL
jgi:hypothetical protein